jgi:SNF2 family DNA or RNA helicase
METIDVPGLNGTLYPFQKQGVAFLERKEGRGLIADEMGLGKTVQALSWLQLHPEKRPAVIVVPASLKWNWKREAEKWLSEPNVQVLSGKKPTTPIIGDIVVINYDILADWTETLKEIKPQVLITDECHYYKNNQAKRTKAVKDLGKAVPHIIALSGTPVVNRPIEAYNALSLIDKGVVPSFWKFANRYCAAKHTGFGWDLSGASNTEELHQKLTNTVMIRRRKDQVLTELPAKTRSHLPMELGNRERKQYDKADANLIAWLKENKGDEAAEKASNAEALTRIEHLKQLAAKGKMKQAIDWIRDFIEVDGKLVVFATHKDTIAVLMDEFRDVAVKVDGSVSGEARQNAVDKFQNDDSVRLFIGNIRAAGVGITLTAASNVAFVELPWTPGELDQAEDRCHRIGQKDAVNVYYLLAEGTIEEEIAELLDNKRQVLDSILDGKLTDETSLLKALMERHKEG